MSTPKLTPEQKWHMERALVKIYKQEADQAWNDFANSHAEERAAYEADFDSLSEKIGIRDQKDAEEAYKELVFKKHKRYCLGHAGEPGAFHLLNQVVFWEDQAAAYGVDKDMQDPTLNEIDWTFKVWQGYDSPADHRYEPVKGQVFLPGGPTQKPKDDYDRIVFTPPRRKD